MTLGFTWVAALLFMAWFTGRRVFLWPAFVLGLCLRLGLALSGHSAGRLLVGHRVGGLGAPDRRRPGCGGLVQLATCVWPAAPELRRESFLRFARLAPVLIAVLVAAGVYLSILRLPALSDLWSTTYGQVLLVKLGLVSFAPGLGGFHHSSSGRGSSGRAGRAGASSARARSR